MLQAGELELPAGTTILAVLRSLLDADMLTKSSAASKPGVGGGVASGLGGGVASGAYCFKHASVQAVAEHVLSQELKLKLHRAAARDYEAQYAALADKHEASFELLQLLAHHWRKAVGACGDSESSRMAGKYLRMWLGFS